MLSYMKYVTLNKQAITKSNECACIYCFKLMKPCEITEYCLDKDTVTNKLINETALCPYCGIDSIIPNSLVNYTKNDLEKWHLEGWGLL